MNNNIEYYTQYWILNILKLWVLEYLGKWAPSWNYPWHFSVSQRNSYSDLRNTRSNKPLQKEWLWPSRAVSLISFCKDSFPLKRGTNKLLRLKLVINLEYKSFHNNSHCNKTNNMFWNGYAAQNLKTVCTMNSVE